MLEQDETKEKHELGFEIEFGKPYRRKHSKFDSELPLEVIPVEIEMDSMLYMLIRQQILEVMDDSVSFEEWVNICFKERMEQILSDPKEFGKTILNYIRRGYCLPTIDSIENDPP